MKKYILAAFLIIFAIAPVVSHGVTINKALMAQLKARVNTLQRQLSQLQNQLADCPFHRDLSLGDGSNDGLSPDVIMLQKWLRASGYLNTTKPTGRFNETTMIALKRWQNKNNLAATGAIGARERLALCGK